MRSMLVVHAALLVVTTTSARAQQPDQLTDPQAPAGRRAVGCGQVAEYVPGTAAAGEFTVFDCFTLNAGLRQPVDYWRFHTDVRRDIQAVIEAPGLQVHLRLLTEDGWR
jgi:hypothetical protein